MIYRFLADCMIVLHGLFILFVVLGGFLVLRWKKLIWIHLPVVAWGALVEFANWICPLTPWENHFRRLAGEAVYEGDFIGRYILPMIYPEDLTRGIQIILGSLVVVINVVVYAIIVARHMKQRKTDELSN